MLTGHVTSESRSSCHLRCFFAIFCEFRYGHFVVIIAAQSHGTKMSNELSFFAIISPFFSMPVPAVDTETGTNVYIDFPFIVLTSRNLR